MPLVSKNFSDIITFSRLSGATWFNATGTLIGIDFSSTSETVGTGSKSFTLDATAGVDRYWTPGDPVRIGDASNPSTNYMDGVVSSYTASTQVLVVNVTSVGGSGTFTAWRVSNLSPRFDYDPATLAARGFLIEEQRTNLVLQSEDFANSAGPVLWVWPAGVVTGNTEVDPDGTTTADTVTSSGSAQSVYQSITVTASTAYTFSVFVKLGTMSAAGYKIAIYDNIAATFIASDIVPTQVPNTSSWTRISYTFTTPVGCTSVRVYPFRNAAPITSSTVFIWGAQLEAGAFVTSYIPTTTIQATRSADVASVNTLSPWYNSTQGTLYAEAQISAGVGSSPAAFASLDDTTTANRIQVRRASPGNLASFRMVSSAGSIDVTLVSGTLTGVNKTAAAFTASNQNAVNNGTLFTGITPIASMPTVTRLLLGDGAGSLPINGWLRRVSYYPRRLSDAELQAITA